MRSIPPTQRGLDDRLTIAGIVLALAIILVVVLALVGALIWLSSAYPVFFAGIVMVSVSLVTVGGVSVGLLAFYNSKARVASIEAHHKTQLTRAQRPIPDGVQNLSWHDSSRQQTTEQESAPALAPPLSLDDWMGRVNDRIDDAPHTMVVGDTGSGKTTLVQALLAKRAGLIVIADPKAKRGKWGGLPYTTIDDDGKLTAIERLMRSVMDEFQRRLVISKQSGASGPPLTVVLDEYVYLHLNKTSASELFTQVGSMGREYRMRLVILVQSSGVASLGIEGQGVLRDNFTIIRLGKSATAAHEECKGQQRPACLEWQGDYWRIETAGLPSIGQTPIDMARYWTPTPQIAAPTPAQQLVTAQAPAPVAQPVYQPVPPTVRISFSLEDNILSLLARRPMTAAELEKELADYSPKTIYNNLTKLKRDGRIRNEGKRWLI